MKYVYTFFIVLNYIKTNKLLKIMKVFLFVESYFEISLFTVEPVKLFTHENLTLIR